MSEILFLPATPVVLRAFPCDAHHYGNNDGDLHGTDDGGDQDVVQLLSTGDHVEDVEVLRLVTLRTFVSCVTSAGGHVVLVDLTFPVNAETGEAVGTRDGHSRVETFSVIQNPGVQDVSFERAAVVFLALFFFISI